MKNIIRLRLVLLLLNQLVVIAIMGQNYVKIDSLQRSLLKSSSIENKVNTLLIISREFESSNADSGLKFAKKAFTIAVSKDYNVGKVNALILQGRFYTLLNDFSQGLESYKSAVSLAEKKGLTNETAIATGGIALYYAEFGDYDNSATYNFRALKLFEKAGNRKEIGVTLGNIAADMLYQKQYVKALDYMNKALDIAKEIKDKPGIAQQYNNIAAVYFSSYKDYAKAMDYFKNAFQVNTDLGDKLQAGINLLNIGHCHFNKHENDSAIQYYSRALKIFSESGNPFRLANCEIALGNYYKEISDFNESLKHSQEALKIGLQLNSNELIIDASDILRNVYLLKHDTINAFRYSEIKSQAKDSLQVMQSQNNSYKLEYQYNYEKLDKEKKLKQLRNYYIMGFVILGLLASIIIVLLIYSRQRIKVKNTNLEKEKMVSELNFKNKELTINLMALMKKNEMISGISRKLVAIEKRMPRNEFRENIAKLNKEVTHSADEKIWKEFALRFHETNSDFYEKLLEKYPDLTQNELRLTAYLRLNMTSKEISEVTGQRILTLESARYRLRKKLGISGSENNLVTFLSQI